MKLSIKKSFMFVLIILALTFSAIGVTPAYAAIFIVTKTADTNDGTCDSDCSLREAITAANANGAGSDTITFVADYTITLGSQLPVVTTTIIINGNGVANTIVQASTCNPVTLPGGCTPAGYRVFRVSKTGKLTLDGLTVRHGNCGAYSSCEQDDYGGFDEGGGAYNTGTLILTNSIFTGNSANFGGGVGGFSTCTITVTNSTFSGNSAIHTGGGLFTNYNSLADPSPVTLTDSIFSDNTASYNGGGVYNREGHTLTVTNSTFSGNSATSGIGGGIYNDSKLYVTNSIFSDNSAGGSSGLSGGGGIYNDSYHGVLTVADSTFSGNIVASLGGGIYNGGTVTLADSSFSDNSAVSGGGIYNTGPLTIMESSFSDNSTTSYGGGIYNQSTLTLTSSSFLDNSAVGHGGGIYNNYHNDNPTIITNSTFSGNSSIGDDGGGIYNGSFLTVTNSTFSNNSAAISRGGGIFNDATLTLANSSFSGNFSAYGGGIRNLRTLNYANTIIANSSAGGDCVNSNTLGTNTNNLVEDGSCSALLSGDPKLDTLASNGGTTQTFALLTGSSAIDAGNNTICEAAPVNNTSQNGVTRPQGAACDIGSYELDSATSKDITAFSFTSPTATGVITGTNIALTVPFGTNVTALAATFATNGASVVVGATPQVSGTTANNFTNPVTYTVTAADASTKDYIVTVTVAAPSANKDITAFSFTNPSAAGVITGTNIAVTVPFGTNLTGLVATFTTTGASVAVGATPQISGTTANNFTNPVTYTVTAADATTKDYIVTVTVAPATVYTLFLPLILR